MESNIWTIPAERMKAQRSRRVPLSREARDLLLVLREFHPELIFPSSNGGMLSDMTLSALLRRLKVSATVHGFRSSFRDWAEESMSYAYAAKEAALAHTVKNRVEAAYRRSDLLDVRTRMMQDWADHLTQKSP